MTIKFPKFRQDGKWRKIHKLYREKGRTEMHFNFVLQVFLEAGLHVEFYDPEGSYATQGHFEVRFGDRRIMFDVADGLQCATPDICEPFDAIFKFHWSREHHKHIPHMYPFSPISFCWWDEYHELREKIQYRARGKVLNNQRAFGNALERRRKVQNILVSYFGELADTRYYGNRESGKRTYWMGANKALASVHVPGNRPDMLDRGQGQMMGFGVCTVSPPLMTTLPFYRTIEPWVHMVPVNNDYSDLVTQLEWIRLNPQEAIKIGQNAQELFDEVMAPTALVEWIRSCLGME